MKKVVAGMVEQGLKFIVFVIKTHGRDTRIMSIVYGSMEYTHREASGIRE